MKEKLLFSFFVSSSFSQDGEYLSPERLQAFVLGFFAAAAIGTGLCNSLIRPPQIASSAENRLRLSCARPTGDRLGPKALHATGNLADLKTQP